MTSNTTQSIAETAARLLADHHTLDYGWARRKAAESLGFKGSDKQLPSYAEIESAVVSHQQIFDPAAELVSTRLQAAAELLQMFEKFTPRLVGPLSRGITASNAVINIDCFAEAAKLVLFELMDAEIEAESGDVTVMTSSHKREDRPAFGFFYKDHEVLLVVLSPDEYRHPPLDPVTEKPGYGLDVEDIEKQLSESS